MQIHQNELPVAEVAVAMRITARAMGTARRRLQASKPRSPPRPIAVLEALDDEYRARAFYPGVLRR